jgi:hypothetical protein
MSTFFQVIASVQIVSLFGALVAQGSIFLAATGVSRRYWGLVYPLLILFLSSTLAWQAMIPIPWLRPAVLSATGLLGLCGVFYSRGLHVQGGHALKRAMGPQVGWKLGTILVSGLLIELLYASFPAYRYDQWNYHLIVAKIIDQMGSLPQPVLYDHTYFAGIYEYLFTLIRVFTQNDLINQGVADTFTWLTFVVGLYGLVGLLAKAFDIRVGLLVLVGYMVFAVPEHEAIFNAKPDILLLLFALGAMVSWHKMRESPRLGSFMLGAYLVAPLGLKVTWIHFLLALGLALGLSLRHHRQRFSWGPLGLGLLFGGLIALPQVVKNFYFFGNPLHPSQFGPLHSRIWGTMWDEYWATVDHRAHAMGSYLRILVLNIPAVLLRLRWFLVGFLIVRFSPKNMAEEQESDVSSIALKAFLLYLILWPIFYDQNIYDRFVYPLFALAIMGLLSTLRGRRLYAWQVAVLCFVIPLNGSLDAKVNRMVTRGGETVPQYFSQHGEPLNHHPNQTLVNEHRRNYAPDADFMHSIVLTDTRMTYFLDSQGIDISGPDYQWIALKMGLDGTREQALRFARCYHISYIHRHYLPFADWPKELQPLIAVGEPLNSEGSVLVLPEDLGPPPKLCPGQGAAS